MKLTIRKVYALLDEAQEYADIFSGCKKVAVGSMLIPATTDETRIFGVNCTLPISCRENGCQREELYGDDNKSHRLPSDCRAVHSEIDAITCAAKYGFATNRAVIIVTRYPCEACARAIVKAGIKAVFYGRQQEISEQTKNILKAGGVRVFWMKEWNYEDVTT